MKCLAMGLLSTIFLAAAACAPAGAPSASASKEGANYSPYIVNGTDDLTHTGVGLLQIESQMCTATVIGERTLLTAAHCIRYPDQLRSGYFWLYAEDGSLSETYFPQKVTNHPGYHHKPGEPDQAGAYDIAVIVVHKPIANVNSALISTVPPATGQAITLLGFGATNNGEDGMPAGDPTRRQVGTVIDSVNPMTFLYSGEKNTWYGDSGGPTFATINGQEVIIGNHSGGEYKKFGLDMRTDYFCSWLVKAAAGDIKLQDDKCPDYSPEDGGLSDLAGAAASLPPQTQTPSPPAADASAADASAADASAAHGSAADAGPSQ